MNLQQSLLYRQYIQSLKWNVIIVNGVYIFIKRFPLFGSLAKLQRSNKLPDIQNLLPVLKKYHVRSIAVEPEYTMDQQLFNQWCQKLRHHVRLSQSPFLPTKTILIDLTPSESKLFDRFTEAKRRAVRRAQKNNLQIYKSTNINDLITIKNKSAGFLGFLTTFGIKKLWPIFGPNNAAILLAYSDTQYSHVVGGILLLFCGDTAYYWIAGATREGKKLFAPTLLVWEALKLSKKRGMKQFDFVGAWDERLPKQYDAWKGFTKFKEGFGGKNMYYPLVFFFGSGRSSGY